MNKFKKYIKEECSGSSADIASVDTKVVKKKKKVESKDSETIKEAIDFNKDGKIDINDLIFMTKNLGAPAIREIIDLVASYLIKKYEEPSDIMPSDGVYRTYTHEAIIRKIRGDKIVLKSSIPGYKITSNGMEVKMTDADLKQRVLDAIEASKRRNARNRKAIKMDDLEEPFEDEIEDIDEPEDDLDDYEEDEIDEII